ncbi:MAG: hypothetical protein CME68_09140 [Halobacteriovoraceae bacterium]|nr:hypothetical protein [Halobacteriovoraceae bacterium]
MEKKETAKTRIIEASRALFSEVGFESTSVREIAKKASVNLASINYYFKSKKNLLAEIFLLNFKTFSECLDDLYERRTTWTIEEFSTEVFDLLDRRKEEFYSAFQIFFNDGVPLPSNLSGDSSSYSGPPGGETFKKVIDNNLGTTVEEWRKEWVMRTLFNNIVWEFVVLQTNYAKISEGSEINRKESLKRISNLCHCLVSGVKNDGINLSEVRYS